MRVCGSGQLDLLLQCLYSLALPLPLRISPHCYKDSGEKTYTGFVRLYCQWLTYLFVSVLVPKCKMQREFLKAKISGTISVFYFYRSLFTDNKAGSK
jgi:hypothetical protein